MAQLNTIGVDLAKSVIQVSVVTPGGKELVNKSLTRTKFGEVLATQQPSMIAFEECGSTSAAGDPALTRAVDPGSDCRLEPHPRPAAGVWDCDPEGLCPSSSACARDSRGWGERGAPQLSIDTGSDASAAH